MLDYTLGKKKMVESSYSQIQYPVFINMSKHVKYLVLSVSSVRIKEHGGGSVCLPLRKTLKRVTP